MLTGRHSAALKGQHVPTDHDHADSQLATAPQSCPGSCEAVWRLQTHGGPNTGRVAGPFPGRRLVVLCGWGSNLHGLSGIPTHLSDPQPTCPCSAGTHTHIHLLSVTLQLVNTPSISIPFTAISLVGLAKLVNVFFFLLFFFGCLVRQLHCM